MPTVIPVAAPTGLGPRFAACRALVVEPRIGVRRGLHDLLIGLGVARVDASAKVEPLWRQLDEGRFNVLFLDWSAAVDAPAILQTLRAPDNRHRFLPVVVMSGYSDLAHVARARDCGASEYLFKPFSAEMVTSRLLAIVCSPRLFIGAGGYFGPDRRRRRDDWQEPERRRHQNWRAGDRRREDGKWTGPERRQCRPGFEPLDRRTAPRA